MIRVDKKKEKMWGLKPLILACIIPIFIGASIADIVSNYLMAKRNANARIHDYTHEMRTYLAFLTNLPSLRMYLVDIKLGLNEEAAFLKEDVQGYLADYLKNLQLPLPYTLSLISPDGKELIRIKDGKAEPAQQDFSASPHFKKLSEAQSNESVPLPVFSHRETEVDLVDISSVRDEISHMMIGGLIHEYRIPLDQFMSHAHNVLVFNIFLNIAIAFIALVMIYFALVIITSPLKHLTKASQEMLGGDFSRVITVGGWGETQLLAKTFEAMRRQIKSQIEQLQDNARKLEAIIDFLPDATFIIDQDSKILFWNKAIEEMTGCPRESMLGKGNYEYAIPFYKTRRSALIDFAFKEAKKSTEGDNGAQSSVEGYFVPEGQENSIKKTSWCPMLKGNKRLLSATASSLYDDQKNLWGAIECIRDVTDVYEMEKEKIHLQEQLYQAQKMEAIGTLAGGIAHDFNNILGAILGYTELAKGASPPDSVTVKNLDKVIDASHRAATLVKQILAFSRQAVIEKTLLYPASIVKEAMQLLRPSLPSTIAIKQQIDTAAKPILADPSQVHQILMNLCTNAFHAMERTGGTLEITLNNCELTPSDLQQHPEVSPGHFVVLSVSDTGVGIDPAILGRIFDPYFTTKEVGKGTGMGLSIVHGIVTSYGGFITGASNRDHGMIFRVYFPAIDQEIVSEVKPAETAPSGTEHLLWVDDEKSLAELGQTMLEGLGYKVTIRTCSQEALTVFEEHPNLFDAVITDQTMPGMTGMDLARRMLEIRPEIPIILCTGYSSLINEKQAKAEGIKGFAMKPLSKEVIAALLRRVLDREIPAV